MGEIVKSKLHDNEMIPTKNREKFVPQNLEQLDKFVLMIAEGGMTPKSHCDKNGKPNLASMKAAIVFGDTLGVGPLASLKNICVINNVPSVWGDLALALCQAHPAFIDVIEEEIQDGWRCTAKRRGKEDVVREFTIEDAKKANLWEAMGVREEKRQFSPWVKYPKRMLQMRARGFAIRDQFPDALSGLNIAEEYIDVEPIVAETESPKEQLRALQKETEEQKAEEPKQSEPEPQKAKEEAIDYVTALETVLADLGELNYQFSDKEKKRITELTTDEELINAIGYYEKKKAELSNSTKEG